VRNLKILPAVLWVEVEMLLDKRLRMVEIGVEVGVARECVMAIDVVCLII
jgi:hypothetical protein